MRIHKLVIWTKRYLPTGFDMKLRSMYISLSLIAGQPLIKNKKKVLPPFFHENPKTPIPLKKNVLVLLHWAEGGGSFKMLFDCMSALKDEFNFRIAYTVEPGSQMAGFAPLAVEIFPIRLREKGENQKFVQTLIEEKKIHSVLVIDIVPEPFFLLEYFFTAGIPIVSWLHYDVDILKAHKKMLSAMEKFISKIIVVNGRVKRYLDDYIDSKKIELVPNGIDTNFFSKGTYNKEAISGIKKSLDINDEHLVVTYAGRLEKLKNPGLFIDSAIEVLKTKPDVFFLLAGDGSLSESLEHQVKIANFEKKILFLGYIENIRDILAITDVFVQPSLSESFGLSAAEAMSMKIPVIANKIGGLADLIKNGADGITTEKPTKLLFSENILELLESSELRKKFGAAARAKIIKHYSLEKTVKSLGTILKTVTTQS